MTVTRVRAGPSGAHCTITVAMREPGVVLTPAKLMTPPARAGDGCGAHRAPARRSSSYVPRSRSLQQGLHGRGLHRAHLRAPHRRGVAVRGLGRAPAVGPEHLVLAGALHPARGGLAAA